MDATPWSVSMGFLYPGASPEEMAEFSNCLQALCVMLQRLSKLSNCVQYSTDFV